MPVPHWIPYYKKRPHRFWLGLLLISYLINGIYYIRAQSVTFDEGPFLFYAARFIKGNPERVNPQADNSKMPVVVLNLIPRAIEQAFHPGLKKTDNGISDVLAGRYITLFFSLGIILLVYQWASECYGEKAGLFSAFLICFFPDMIASAGLVTTDNYSMLFLLLTLYCLWKFCRSGERRFFFYMSLAAALSQLVKQSLFHLYFIIPGILIVFFVYAKPRLTAKKTVLYSLLFILIQWGVINVAYSFRNTNLAFGSYTFQSHSFQNLQKVLPAGLPLPLPRDFITGLDQGKYYDEIGSGNRLMHSHATVTVLGNSSTSGGFWYYYLVSIFYKTPVSLLIFILTAGIVLIKRKDRSLFFNNEFFLLVPVFYFLIYLSFFYRTQIGIRQIIFIFPFLCILCGILVSVLHDKYSRIVFAGLSLFLVISVLRYWANYYPYSNEFIWDKKMAWRYVGAANLEFGQGEKFFKSYLRAHPNVQIPGNKPEPGIFLLNTNQYMDVWNEHSYPWIRRLMPSGEVAYNGLLITVRPEDLR